MTGECHSTYGDASHVHRPVAMGVCKICHRPSDRDRHEFSLAREGSGLCEFCHEDITAGPSLHHDVWNGGCTLCHDPHGAEYRYLLPRPRIEDTCEDCHDDILRDLSVLHTPVLVEPCTVCHDPHGSASALASATEADRCFRCHENTRQQLETSIHVHEPLNSGSCAACHDPHGSDSAGSLREEVPALCYGCHKEIGIAVESASHPHSVASEPGGCLICHDPHASSLAFALRDDPSTLCAGCHDSEITTEGGDTLPGVGHEIGASEYLHGPVRQRDCGACHDSHGSDHFRLLVEDYSPEFYADFDLANYSLCFSCHPQRKVLTEKTTDLTGFRNGDLNLHYLHVNKPRNGRTCRACHATHGSNAPKHIRDRVTYGQWELPIAFVKSATGGSCESGCHRPRAYDRDVPVDYGGVQSSPPGDDEAQSRGNSSQ